MTLRNHSHMLVQHLDMIGKPLFHIVLALLMFRVQSPVLLIKLFLSQGFVSINGSSEVKPVQILRDMGVAQSLLLESVLPLYEHTSTDKSVLLRVLS